MNNCEKCEYFAESIFPYYNYKDGEIYNIPIKICLKTCSAIIDIVDCPSFKEVSNEQQL